MSGKQFSCSYRQCKRKELRFKQQKFHRVVTCAGVSHIYYKDRIMSEFSTKKRVTFIDGGLTSQDLDAIFEDDPLTVVTCGTSETDQGPHTADPTYSGEEVDTVTPTVDQKKGKRQRKRKTPPSSPLLSSTEDSSGTEQQPQPQVNSLAKKNSPSNPAKRKRLVTPRQTSTSDTVDQLHSQQTSSTQVSVVTFFKIATLALLGMTVDIWSELLECWEMQLAEILDKDINFPDLQLVMECMSALVANMKDSPSQTSVTTFLGTKVNSCWLKSMHHQAGVMMKDFFNRFKSARVRMQSQLSTEENSATLPASTTSLHSHTTTLSTYVPGTGAAVGVAGLRAQNNINSATDVHTRSQGWTVKSSNQSSFITWVDPSFQYTVKSLDNSGDLIVKTEIYSRETVADLPPQEWWKYPLHRSRLEITQGSQEAVLLKEYTNYLEQLWVDPRTGEHKVSGLSAEKSVRQSPQPRRVGGARAPQSLGLHSW